MKLRERICIAAPQETVWTFLIDPTRWLSWNDKLIHISRTNPGPLTAGEQFGSRWRMNAREQNTEILVRQVEPLERLVVRQYSNSSERSCFLEITFELTRKRQQTKCTQIVDHSQTGASFFMQALIWAIYRFGKPVGLTNLQNLKRLAEADYR